MLSLTLFLFALVGAVLVQAFIRVLVTRGRARVYPGRRQVDPTRLAPRARYVGPRQELGDWENEGGSLATEPFRSSEEGAR